MPGSPLGRARKSPLVLEVRRVVRAGVREEEGVLTCSALGLRQRGPGPRAVADGLCSDELFLRVAGRSWRLPPWFTSRSRQLPHGALAAAVACVSHFGSGMSLILAALGLTLAVGVVGGSLALVALATFGLVLCGSILVHELGHVLAYRILMGATAPAVLVVRGASCRVLRRRGPRGADLSVVLAGSAAPVAAAICSWPLLPLAPSAVFLGALVAVGHVVGLVLPFGDGAALREIAHGR